MLSLVQRLRFESFAAGRANWRSMTSSAVPVVPAAWRRARRLDRGLVLPVVQDGLERRGPPPTSTITPWRPKSCAAAAIRDTAASADPTCSNAHLRARWVRPARGEPNQPEQGSRHGRRIVIHPPGPFAVAFACPRADRGSAGGVAASRRSRSPASAGHRDGGLHRPVGPRRERDRVPHAARPSESPGRGGRPPWQR